MSNPKVQPRSEEGEVTKAMRTSLSKTKGFGDEQTVHIGKEKARLL